MCVLRASATIMVIATVIAVASPSNAAPNTGRYQQSSEALKQWQVDCTFYKGMLDAAERDANKRAGTKAAAKYAKEADKWWAKGESAGCAWAQ